MGFSSSLLLSLFVFPTNPPSSLPLSACPHAHLSLISNIHLSPAHQAVKAKDAASSTLSSRVCRPGMNRNRPLARSKAPGGYEGKNEEERIPEWAKPGSDIAPPWAQQEGGSSTQQQQAFQPPFFLYLICSVLVAIAAVGSIFEFFNKSAVFGVIQPDSPLYIPLLGFFALTGFPMSAFLWYKSIVLANKLAEDQDREDGFLDR